MHFFLYLAAINALTYFLYWRDKRAARAGGWRISEATLLVAGFLGGSPAGLIAQRRLRHKNRKGSYQLKFWAVVLLQAYLILFPPVMLQRLFAHLFG